MQIDFAALRAKLVIYAQTKMRVAADVAEDLAQEALITVFRHQERFSSVGHAQAYGFLSVRHKCIEQERLRRKFFVAWDETLERIIPAPDNQYQALLLNQMIEYIESCSNAELNAVLASALGYEADEIAEHSTFRRGVDKAKAVNAVRTRVKRGRAHLREVFA